MPIEVSLDIELSGLDTDALLRSWRWLVPTTFKPIKLTKFGDWFLLAPGAHVFMLDLIEGELTDVAESVSRFNDLVDFQEYQANWFLDGFVFRCHREGLQLAKGQCYGWKLHPMIGGSFSFENIQVFDLTVYQTLMGQLLRQWKALPPGSPIPPIVVK